MRVKAGKGTNAGGPRRWGLEKDGGNAKERQPVKTHWGAHGGQGDAPQHM